MRTSYANKVFWFLCAYAVFSLLLLLLEGFQIGGFHLNDSVLLAVVGSTAVGVVGIVGFVVRGLFGAPRRL